MVTKHVHPEARLVAARRVRKPVDLERLRALVRSMPRQPEGAGRALRRMRDVARY